jgi:DNA-binding beta-propeller fold protein YncE
MRWKLLLAALAIVLGAGILFACSQTPTSVPIRTFERAQRVDTICLRVFGDNAPEPLPPDNCAPVPPTSTTGGSLENQLYALVTQTSRGEVAVVNLSAGVIIDQKHAVPGQNFLPVGAIPTDIATTPDGRMAFVAAAEPNKFAIYGIPGHRILGDSQGHKDPDGPTALNSWPVCSLPQRPGSLTIVPTGDLTQLAAYNLVAVLPGDRTTPAKVVLIDPKPFLRGAPRLDHTKTPATPIDDFGPGATLTPGELLPCPIIGEPKNLSGSETLPSSFTPGTKWDDGVKWADGGVDISCQLPEQSVRCEGRSCGCGDTAGPDGGASLNDAGAACTPTPDGGTTAPSTIPLDLGPLDAPLPVAIARDDKTLYVADDALPLVHVIDLSTPGQIRELPPFVISSLTDPARVATIRDLAVSPATREYKRFLYAVDRKDGTIVVFDITDPNTAQRTPMRRPHPELNPFQPEDRLAFGAPAVAVAFARHDFPLTRINGKTLPSSKSGLLCNPNSNDIATSPIDPGSSYRANSIDTDVQLLPTRLRGIFALVTLSNGQVVIIDVDDWDAPCRRPSDLSGAADVAGNFSISSLEVPQPAASSANDLDPYHAPIAAPNSVTNEIFFPVSAPHRLRSTYLLRDDPVTGDHIPFLVSQPAIQGTGAPIPMTGQGSEATPRIRSTALRPGVVAGTQDYNIRFSVDTPDVQFDQDWTVTYEGILPNFTGLPAAMTTTDNYQSLTLTQPNARFCAKGVEDWTVGGERGLAVTSALSAAGRALPEERFDRRMIDYVQITDDLLAPTDPFWTLADLPGDQACWTQEANGKVVVLNDPASRYNACLGYFGAAASQSTARDFPILEAYDDHVVVGRFAKIGTNNTREAIYADPSNAPFMKLARCCFHEQINFNVRAGAQWVTVGSTLGLMSHLQADSSGRCAPSCDPHESLLNARTASLPFDPSGDFAPYRDSPLAMRNPSFSFFIQNGFKIDKGVQIDNLPTRDTFYHFQTRGQFTPLLIDISGGTGSTSVDPQSMRFIDALGQVAVVDGASQGLILIDLALVAIARAPYF